MARCVVALLNVRNSIKQQQTLKTKTTTNFIDFFAKNNEIGEIDWFTKFRKWLWPDFDHKQNKTFSKKRKRLRKLNHTPEQLIKNQLKIQKIYNQNGRIKNRYYKTDQFQRIEKYSLLKTRWKRGLKLINNPLKDLFKHNTNQLKQQKIFKKIKLRNLNSVFEFLKARQKRDLINSIYASKPLQNNNLINPKLHQNKNLIKLISVPKPRQKYNLKFNNLIKQDLNHLRQQKNLNLFSALKLRQKRGLKRTNNVLEDLLKSNASQSIQQNNKLKKSVERFQPKSQKFSFISIFDEFSKYYAARLLIKRKLFDQSWFMEPIMQAVNHLKNLFNRGLMNPLDMNPKRQQRPLRDSTKKQQKQELIKNSTKLKNNKKTIPITPDLLKELIKEKIRNKRYASANGIIKKIIIYL